MPQPGGVYLIQSMLTPGKAMDIEGGSAQPGADVINWDRHGNPNQKFRLQPMNGAYQLIPTHSNIPISVSSKR